MPRKGEGWHTVNIPEELNEDVERFLREYGPDLRREGIINKGNLVVRGLVDKMKELESEFKARRKEEGRG